MFILESGGHIIMFVTQVCQITCNIPPEDMVRTGTQVDTSTDHHGSQPGPQNPTLEFCPIELAQRITSIQ